MRLSFLTTLAFAGSILAAPAVQAPAQEISDIKFVLDAYKVINSNAAKLAGKITSLKPGDDVIARLKEMSTLSGSTIKILEQLIKDINAKPGKMSSAAATSLAKPSAESAMSTVKIIDDLVAKKDLFVKAKVHKIVLDDLNHLAEEAGKFVAAAKAKVPDQFAAVSAKAFDTVLEALAKGIKNFS
jgi:hypothetical protein